MDVKYLTLDEIRLSVYNFVKENLKFDEPLPSFQTADINKIDSILSSLQQSVVGKDAYPTLTNKASVLFYKMIKNHPFMNGNKRMAIVSLFLFLAKNGRWLDMEWETIYYLAKSVAQSSPQDYETILVFINETIENNLSEFTPAYDDKKGQGRSPDL